LRTSDRFAFVRRTVAVALVMIAVAGCGGGSRPVRVTGAPTPTATAAASCRALLAALPDSLGKGLGRRSVSPDGVFAAAYGKRPVLVTCGADGVPAGYQKTSEVAQVDRVSWFSEQAADNTRLSTPTRRPQVSVLLPADAPSWDILVAVAPSIVAHTVSTVPETPEP
jgi:Protein of unknown function (DUF3515)